MSYRDIAARLGVSSTSAYELVNSEYEQLGELVEDAARSRMLHTSRLHRLLYAVWDSAMQGERSAVLSALEILDRLSALAGINAVLRAEISGPDGGSIKIEDARDILTQRLAAAAEHRVQDETPGDSQ